MIETPKPVRWRDGCGVLRCSHFADSFKPRVATTIVQDGFAFVIGDADLAKRAAQRRAREDEARR